MSRINRRQHHGKKKQEVTPKACPTVAENSTITYYSTDYLVTQIFFQLVPLRALALYYDSNEIHPPAPEGTK